MLHKIALGIVALGLSVVIGTQTTAANKVADVTAKGQYVEARTCDIWTGPCFANAEMNLSGKNALIAWKVDSGSVGDVRLDGLSVIAIVSARDTLGLAQTAAGKTVLIVDERATKAQREALVGLAKKQG